MRCRGYLGSSRTKFEHDHWSQVLSRTETHTARFLELRKGLDLDGHPGDGYPTALASLAELEFEVLWTPSPPQHNPRPTAMLVDNLVSRVADGIEEAFNSARRERAPDCGRQQREAGAPVWAATVQSDLEHQRELDAAAEEARNNCERCIDVMTAREGGNRPSCTCDEAIQIARFQRQTTAIGKPADSNDERTNALDIEEADAYAALCAAASSGCAPAELSRSVRNPSEPQGLANNTLNMLGGQRYFTSLDLLSGFHQISLHEDSIAKTAFVTMRGL